VKHIFITVNCTACISVWAVFAFWCWCDVYLQRLVESSGSTRTRSYFTYLLLQPKRKCFTIL